MSPKNPGSCFPLSRYTTILAMVRAAYAECFQRTGTINEGAKARVGVKSARWPPCGAATAAFADSTMRGGWAGMIMMSPDGRPITDQLPSIPGLYVMLGDSGTSF